MTQHVTTLYEHIDRVESAVEQLEKLMWEKDRLDRDITQLILWIDRLREASPVLREKNI